MDPTFPKVCVGVTTFNHASYIRQALDSVLAQQTEFDFKIVVHDDCSTDGTQDILREYAAAFPGRVNAILQTENQFSKGRRVVLLLMEGMSGEYFALLDGDDFWTDPSKLQMQADFLDANPGCALCQTLSHRYSEAEKRTLDVFPPRHRRSRKQLCKDLAFGNFVQTSAVMFRASAVPVFPPEYNDLKFGDLGLFAMLAQAGWIGTIGPPMVTYRIHADNLWATKAKQARIEATRDVQRFLAANLRPELREPWTKAANNPRARLNPNLKMMCLDAWGRCCNALRRSVGMDPA